MAAETAEPESGDIRDEVGGLEAGDGLILEPDGHQYTYLDRLILELIKI